MSTPPHSARRPVETSAQRTHNGDTSGISERAPPLRGGGNDGLGGGKKAKQTQTVRLTRAASLRQQYAKSKISELEESEAGGGAYAGGTPWSNAQPQPWVSPVTAESGEGTSPLQYSRGKSRDVSLRRRREWDSSPPAATCDESGEETCRETRTNQRSSMYATGRPFDHGQLGRPWGKAAEGVTGGGMWFNVDLSDEKPIRPGRQQSSQGVPRNSFSQAPPSTPKDSDIRVAPLPTRNVWSVEMAQERYGNSPLWS